MSLPIDADGEASQSLSGDSPLQRVQRVRHELRRRQCTVRRVERLGPGFARVQLAGEALRSFTSLSFDDHVRIFLPQPAGSQGSGRPTIRNYTPRAFDAQAGTLDLEFALHSDGPASNWAAGVRPGDPLEIGGPRGSVIIPADFDWHLLAGDETALPAIARRVEELPAGTPVTAWITVRDPADRRVLSTRANLSVHWLDGRRAGALAGAAQTWTLPPGEGFAWAAGEATEIAMLRQLLVGHLGLHKARVRASAYWKLGRDDHHEALDA